MRYCLVFLGAFVLDYAWSAYIKAVGEKRAWRATGWSAFIGTMGGLVVMGYIENRMLLIPYILGGAFGTYWSVKKSNK